MLTFAFGAALAGAGGALLAPVAGVVPNMGQAYVGRAFMTVVVGGPGVLTGTAAGRRPARQRRLPRLERLQRPSWGPRRCWSSRSCCCACCRPASPAGCAGSCERPAGRRRRPRRGAAVTPTRRDVGLGAVLLLAGCVLAGAAPDYRAQEWSLWVIYGLLALSFTFVWGHAGIFSFGQAAFFGIGAYALRRGRHQPVADDERDAHRPARRGAGGGAVRRRSSGYFIFYGNVGDVYVAIITLAVTLVLLTVMSSTARPEVPRRRPPRSGGYNGLVGVPPLMLPGADVPVLLGATPCSRPASRSPSSVAVTAQRPAPPPVRARRRRRCARTSCAPPLLGYDVRRYKLGAFVIGGACRGPRGRALRRLGAVHQPGGLRPAAGGAGRHLGAGRWPHLARSARSSASPSCRGCPRRSAAAPARRPRSCSAACSSPSCWLLPRRPGPDGRSRSASAPVPRSGALAAVDGRATGSARRPRGPAVRGRRTGRPGSPSPSEAERPQQVLRRGTGAATAPRLPLPARHRACPDRPQRRRQEHLLQPAHRPVRAHPRARAAGRRRHHPAAPRPAGPAAGSASSCRSPATTPRSPPSRTCGWPAYAAAGQRRRPPTGGPPTSSRGSASRGRAVDRGRDALARRAPVAGDRDGRRRGTGRHAARRADRGHEPRGDAAHGRAGARSSAPRPRSSSSSTTWSSSGSSTRRSPMFHEGAVFARGSIEELRADERVLDIYLGRTATPDAAAEGLRAGYGTHAGPAGPGPGGGGGRPGRGAGPQRRRQDDAAASPRRRACR